MANTLRVFVLTASLFVLSAAQIEKYESPATELEPPDYRDIPVARSGSECGKVISSGLTAAQKKEIVDVHNKHRQFVASGQEKRGKPGPQPPTSNMKTLKWSDELAKTAQAWADKCHWEHNPNLSDAGENMAKSWSSDGSPASLTSEIDRWYDEVKNYNGKNVKTFTGENLKNTGHYTQLVWGETNEVGCGYIRFTGGRDGVTNMLVCDYKPSGNFRGRPVY